MWSSGQPKRIASQLFQFPSHHYGARVHLKTSGKKAFCDFSCTRPYCRGACCANWTGRSAPVLIHHMHRAIRGRSPSISRHCILFFHSGNTHLQHPFLGACLLVLSSKNPPSSPPNTHFLFTTANRTSALSYLRPPFISLYQNRNHPLLSFPYPSLRSHTLPSPHSLPSLPLPFYSVHLYFALQDHLFLSGTTLA